MLIACASCAATIESNFVICPSCGKSTSPDVSDDWIDQRYRPLQEIGRGGMGSVILAEDVHLRRKVAVKFLLEAVEAGAVGADLQAEARALALVRHPHVVAVYTFGTHKRGPFLAMEYVEGPSLSQIIAEHREHNTTVPLGRAVQLLELIAEGLAAVHRAGVVHRDVKPANIMVELRTGRPVLVDFGIAAGTQSIGADVSGTPQYMAPEAFFDDSIALARGPQADLYAFFVTAYELLTGEVPIIAGSIRELIFQKAKNEYRPPSRILRRYQPLDSVFAIAFATEHERRFKTLPEFVDAIRRAAALIDARAVSTPTLSQGESEQTAAPHALAVLAVDDDDVFRKLVMRAVQVAFFGRKLRVKGASTGDAALALDTGVPDLLLLDYDLPGLDGIETLSRLRARPGADKMRVIVVSGRAGADEKWRFRVLGVEDFVQKPVDFQALVKALNVVAGSMGWKSPEASPSDD
jgi:serine/threonine-protein kinase